MKDLNKISKKYKTTKKELGFIKIYNDHSIFEKLCSQTRRFEIYN